MGDQKAKRMKPIKRTKHFELGAPWLGLAALIISPGPMLRTILYIDMYPHFQAHCVHSSLTVCT